MLQSPVEFVDIGPQVCYTGVAPTAIQHEDKGVPVPADRQAAGRPVAGALPLPPRREHNGKF